MIYNSCSELLVDTKLYDPEQALVRFERMFQRLGWESSPRLTLKSLLGVMEGNPITVYDKDGNRASLRYGDNGYADHGFYFDSDCNDLDDRCYPIFRAVEEEGGDVLVYDGGHLTGYVDWLKENELPVTSSLGRAVNEEKKVYD